MKHSSDLHSEYTKLNQSFKNKIVYRFGDSAGFYSELNNMIFSMLFCLRNSIRFEINSKENIFSKKGWSDFFTAFCANNTQSWHLRFNHRHVTSRPQSIKSFVGNCYYQFLCYINEVDYLTSDIFHQARNQKVSEEINLPGLFNNLSFLECCSLMIDMVYQFNDETESEIHHFGNNTLLDKPFVGFHIRRGDKKKEAKYTPLSRYIELAEERTEIRTAFVATDDYSVFEELRDKYKDWMFFTYEENISNGYEQEDFNFLDYNTKREQLIRLFASVEVLSLSKILFCSYSSNVGMFLKMRRKHLPTVGVDYNEFIIW